MTIPRILNRPRQSFFLLGPRGTGKSTYLRETLPDAHVINLLSEEMRHSEKHHASSASAQKEIFP